MVVGLKCIEGSISWQDTQMSAVTGRHPQGPSEAGSGLLDQGGVWKKFGEMVPPSLRRQNQAHAHGSPPRNQVLGKNYAGF